MAIQRIMCGHCGHVHEVLKCDVCGLLVSQELDSPGRYVGVWPVDVGQDVVPLNRGALAVVCGESCLRDVGQMVQDQSV